MSKQLVEAVRLLGCASHAAYMLTLRGDIAPSLSDHFKPEVGSMAMEISTFHMRFDANRKLASIGRYPGAALLDNIGTLERVTREPVMAPEKWNEGIENRAEWEVPGDEQVFYLRTLDGREVRWTNARMIKVPDATDFMRGVPAGFQFKQSVIDSVENT